LERSTSISERVIKLGIGSMLVGVLAYWILRTTSFDLPSSKSGGLLVGLGVLLFTLGCGFGDRLKSWIVVSLLVVGSFLFALGGNALIR